MAKHYRKGDPTAEAAIKNADRDARSRAEHRLALAGQTRKIVQEFPAVFEGLIPADCKRVAYRARAIAGGSVWDVKEHHLNQARNELDGPGDAA